MSAPVIASAAGFTVSVPELAKAGAWPEVAANAPFATVIVSGEPAPSPLRLLRPT